MFDDVHYTAQLFYGPYVRIATCIALAQVNMQAYWDLPKPSNYSHDVFQSYYGYIACVGVIINLFLKVHEFYHFMRPLNINKMFTYWTTSVVT